MKRDFLLALALSIVFTSGPMMSAAAYAAEAEKPIAASATHEEAKDAPLVIPETAAGIWQAVDKENDEMAKLITAGTIEDLHHHAFAVRDLIAALPARSETLTPEKLEQVKSDSKYVATLADRLDEAGDGKDKEAAEASFKKLQNLLKSMRENYPNASPK